MVTGQELSGRRPPGPGVPGPSAPGPSAPDIRVSEPQNLASRMERMEKLGDGFEKRMDKVVKRHVDDDDEPKTNKKKKKKEKVESEQDDDDDEEDWKAALRTPTKSQKPPAPVDPKEWKGWQCSAANAGIVKTHFGGGVADYKEDGILEVAETVVASSTCPTKEELKAKPKKESKSKTQPPARWGRLELVTAVLAEVVKK